MWRHTSRGTTLNKYYPSVGLITRRSITRKGPTNEWYQGNESPSWGGVRTQTQSPEAETSCIGETKQGSESSGAQQNTVLWVCWHVCKNIPTWCSYMVIPRTLCCSGRWSGSKIGEKDRWVSSSKGKPVNSSVYQDTVSTGDTQNGEGIDSIDFLFCLFF